MNRSEMVMLPNKGFQFTDTFFLLFCEKNSDGTKHLRLKGRELYQRIGYTNFLSFWSYLLNILFQQTPHTYGHAGCIFISKRSFRNHQCRFVLQWHRRCRCWNSCRELFEFQEKYTAWSQPNEQWYNMLSSLTALQKFKKFEIENVKINWE